MLLIYLPTNSGPVECTSTDFFLPLFRNHVYHHYIFPKFNKRGGVRRKAGAGKLFKN